ncbi:adenine methylase [Salmonella enterica subsp. enterica]|nr:adenine methylase [Salmonella enterica subsp. enterica]
MKKYILIYADPPWSYRDKAADGNRGAGFKYPVMNVLDICRLPAWELAAENCLLAMWWVPTQPAEALEVVKAWGFRLMTMKGLPGTNAECASATNWCWAWGTQPEQIAKTACLPLKAGCHPRRSAGIVQSFTAPRLEHSRKPDHVREKLVQLLGDVPRIELFARLSSHGFDVWGNQCVDPAVKMIPGTVEYIGRRSQ